MIIKRMSEDILLFGKYRIFINKILRYSADTSNGKSTIYFKLVDGDWMSYSFESEKTRDEALNYVDKVLSNDFNKEEQEKAEGIQGT